MNGLSSSNLKKYEATLVALLLNGLRYFNIKKIYSDENEDIVKLTIDLIDNVGLRRRNLAIERNEDIDLEI